MCDKKRSYAEIAEASRRVALNNQETHARQLSMEDLPFIEMPASAMELFSPEDTTLIAPPYVSNSPLLRQVARANLHRVFIPREKDCVALWDRYAMLDNIREHCLKVACLARDMAKMLGYTQGECNPDAAYAAGLLHDLAKTYTIKHGGSHAQLGAAWVMNETRNGAIARSVLFHVHWPWEENIEKYVAEDKYFIALAVSYADKRVRHDEYVTLDERFEDLLDRYAVSELSRKRIENSWRQGRLLEKTFSQRFKVQLETYTPNCRGLVI